jgi:hypothetical protein
MPNDTSSAPTPPRATGTRILFDLEEELRPDELEKFVEAAKRAGAASLTDHFLNLTLRIPKSQVEGGAE